MDNSFDQRPAYYEVKEVAEIEDFDKDQYGNTWYNVLFQGSADTYMWLAKSEPERGKKYYGHLEPTKSGKRLRFRTDKAPEGTPPESKKSEDKYLKDTSDIPRSLVIELLKYYDVQSLYNSAQYTDMINLAQSLNDDITKMIEGNRSGQGDTGVVNKHTESPTPSVKEPQAAAGPLRSAWEDPKNLPKAVSWDDEPPHSDEEAPV